MYRSTLYIQFVVKIQNSWFWNLKSCTFLSYWICIVSARPISITYRYGCWPYRPSPTGKHKSKSDCNGLRIKPLFYNRYTWLFLNQHVFAIIMYICILQSVIFVLGLELYIFRHIEHYCYNLRHFYCTVFHWTAITCCLSTDLGIML